MVIIEVNRAGRQQCTYFSTDQYVKNHVHALHCQVDQTVSWDMLVKYKNTAISIVTVTI